MRPCSTVASVVLDLISMINWIYMCVKPSQATKYKKKKKSFLNSCWKLLKKVLELCQFSIVFHITSPNLGYLKQTTIFSFHMIHWTGCAILRVWPGLVIQVVGLQCLELWAAKHIWWLPGNIDWDWFL